MLNAIRKLFGLLIIFSFLGASITKVSLDDISTSSKVLIVPKLSRISILSGIATVSELSGIVSKLSGILIVSILSGISIVSKLSGSISSKKSFSLNFTKSIISYEVSLIACESSLSKKSSSIQMSSVPTLFSIRSMAPV